MSRRRKLGAEDQALMELIFVSGPLEAPQFKDQIDRINRWWGGDKETVVLVPVHIDGLMFLDLTEEGKYYMGASHEELDTLLTQGEVQDVIEEAEAGHRDDELKVPLCHCPFCDTNQPDRHICTNCGESADQSPGDDGEELTWDSPGVGH